MPSASLVSQKQTQVPPFVVDLQTACKLTGVSDRHLRKFFPDGPAKYLPKLPVCRIGGRLTIRVAALETWLAAVEQS